MEYDNLTHLTAQALKLCLMVSLPAVAVAALTGLAVAFLQAITSLQDSSISQSVKLVIVTVAIMVSAPWGGMAVLSFARSLWEVMFV
ncbi:type III secretion system export apparatus subunit SctS [Massilia sp. Root335]|jgi:type III secretion protein S|uniref:type III secretion system export apparatus subunit SctS n=1 Tax=Massilia sp. Root335 TaxID=1736517 RepID=UPI0006FEB780|nr:type III secretion system export apparatus subunit SctS [Massilia sp. Root335]KQV52361.1 aldolase [Massilia sp. Root335]